MKLSLTIALHFLCAIATCSALRSGNVRGTAGGIKISTRTLKGSSKSKSKSKEDKKSEEAVAVFEDVFDDIPADDGPPAPLEESNSTIAAFEKTNSTNGGASEETNGTLVISAEANSTDAATPAVVITKRSVSLPEETNITEVVWTINLNSKKEQLDVSGVVCSDPFDATNVFDLYGFLKIAAELASAEYMTENDLPGRWSLSDEPIKEGASPAPTIAEEGQRSLFFNGYTFFALGKCSSCRAESTDARRLGGSKAGSEKTLAEEVAESVKKILKEQCTKIKGLSEVTISFA